MQTSEGLLDLIDELCWKLIYAAEGQVERIGSSSADLVDEVVRILGRAIDPGVADLLESAPVFGAKLACIRTYLSREAQSMEFESARAALHGAPVESDYLHTVASRVVVEAAAAGIGVGSLVLFIGCGPYPESALALAERIGCAVVCLDSDYEAVVWARALVRRLRLDELVTVLCADGRDFDPGPFSHVFVASLVPQKREILEMVERCGASDARVIFRYGAGLKRLFNHEAPHFDERKWGMLCSPIQPGHFYDVLVLEKRDSH